MRRLLLFAALFFILDTHGQCPAEGNGKNSRSKELNVLKNSDILPDSLFKVQLDIGELLKNGRDYDRFINGDLVIVEGCLVDYKSGGPETCNCKTDNKNEYDVHLVVGKTPEDLETICFVAETTPKFNKNHSVDYKNMKGKKIRIKGQMFFDYYHKHNAMNTCSSCKRVYRKTAWEIHPVSSIEIIE